MTLWLPGTNPRTDGIYFFNGIQSGTARLQVAGQVMPLLRQEGTGAEFYGQFNTQTFVSADSDVIAVVEVETTATGPDPEVVDLAGTLVVEQAGQRVEQAVVGNAGC